MRYLLLIFITVVSCTNNSLKKTSISGYVYGTTYNIVYFSDDELQLKMQIDSLFNVIDMSMSTYNSNSLITKINNKEDVELDNHFKFVFNVSKNIAWNCLKINNESVNKEVIANICAAAVEEVVLIGMSMFTTIIDINDIKTSSGGEINKKS